LKKAPQQDDAEDNQSRGLMGGVTAFQLRRLADNPWNGGGGYSFEDIANMTLDQIWSRLCDKDILKREIGERSKNMHSLSALAHSDKDGNVKGKSATGESIKMATKGKSKAAMLRDGTYKGKVINDVTGKVEYLDPDKKKKRGR